MEPLKTLDVDGRTIAYRVIDLVPPWQRDNVETIFFHHGLAALSEMWLDWLPTLVGRYRIVLFDMFGCGRSSLEGSPRDWSIDSRVADVFALVDRLELGKIHFVGESYGGTIGLVAGLRAPERFASLGICNASHHGARIDNTDEFVARVERDGVRSWSDRLMRDRFFDDGLPPAKRDWYSWQQGNHTPASIANILRELINVDIADQVNDIELPVLLLHADSSPFISVSVMVELHQQIRNSEFQVFAHSKHGLPFSHSAACAAALSDFLGRLHSKQQQGLAAPLAYTQKR